MALTEPEFARAEARMDLYVSRIGQLRTSPSSKPTSTFRPCCRGCSVRGSGWPRSSVLPAAVPAGLIKAESSRANGREGGRPRKRTASG
jgi:hypothetical protein